MLALYSCIAAFLNLFKFGTPVDEIASMRHFLFGIVISLASCTAALGQTCTANPLSVSTNKNFSALAWTSGGGASCPPSNPTTGTIRVDIAKDVTLTMDQDLTFNGNFDVRPGATGSVLFIPAGVDIHVKGNMGNANNNKITYHVNGTLRVDGTLFGKNDNDFIGTGSISGGSLDLKNGGGCPDPCPLYGGFDDCTVGNTPIICTKALPINLALLTAHLVEGAVAVEWTTTMEERFSKFVVQRADQELVFENIGEVAGKGFDIYNVESKYTFTDKAPLLGLSYYRLKAVDIDETFEYFGPKVVRIEGDKRIEAFPNPSSGHEISLRYNFHPEEADRIIVMNQLGVELFNFPATSAEKIVFSEKLSPGIYLVRYHSGRMEHVNRIVIHE